MVFLISRFEFWFRISSIFVGVVSGVVNIGRVDGSFSLGVVGFGELGFWGVVFWVGWFEFLGVFSVIGIYFDV